MVKCGVKTPREVAILSPGSNGETAIIIVKLRQEHAA
jgi:hypothetical protein